MGAQDSQSDFQIGSLECGEDKPTHHQHLCECDCFLLTIASGAYTRWARQMHLRIILRNFGFLIEGLVPKPGSFRHHCLILCNCNLSSHFSNGERGMRSRHTLHVEADLTQLPNLAKLLTVGRIAQTKLDLSIVDRCKVVISLCSHSCWRSKQISDGFPVQHLITHFAMYCNID